jgi:hypothetical protein
MQKRNEWIAKAAAVAGLVGGLALSTAASAAIESSCPAPCARPPKSAIFLRDPNGVLGVGGSITPLTGTLLKGTAKTVVRVDASVSVTVDASFHAVEMFVTLNGVPPAIGTGLYASPCDSTRSPYCTVTAKPVCSGQEHVANACHIRDQCIPLSHPARGSFDRRPAGTRKGHR